MSRKPIALSPDLLRLENEGYDLDIRGGYLLVRDIPYLDSSRSVQKGILIVQLDLSGDKAVKPRHHVAYWTGTYPCHSNGQTIETIRITGTHRAQELFPGVQADFAFSAKADYRDYHHKVTSYIARITGEATVLDPDATARTYPAIPDEDGVSPFNYIDTASSRAGIAAINNCVAGQKIGIIGLGGTGSYILDLVAKTPVSLIRVFDGDVFSQHNAFRAPGAPSLDELAEKPLKVARFEAIYSKMHKGLEVHGDFVNESNIHFLDGLDFVFVCMDGGPIKHKTIERLVSNGTPFIDVGMGLEIVDQKLCGIVRLTTSTPETREKAAPYISYADGTVGGDEYSTNIQIAELNALNAALAVIQWKKINGIHADTRKQFYTSYSLASGEIIYESCS